MELHVRQVDQPSLGRTYDKLVTSYTGQFPDSPVCPTFPVTLTAEHGYRGDVYLCDRLCRKGAHPG